MEITEIKVKIVPRGSDKLKGFASVTFDHAFVVKDVRIIAGLRGTIVAMPAKKLTFRCPKCSFKNTLRAKFCSECGTRVHASLPRKNPVTGRPILQVDIAHPINPETRKLIEDKVIQAYEAEYQKFRQAEEAAQGQAISQVQNAIRSASGGFDDDLEPEDLEEQGAAESSAAKPSPPGAPGDKPSGPEERPMVDRPGEGGPPEIAREGKPPGGPDQSQSSTTLT